MKLTILFSIFPIFFILSCASAKSENLGTENNACYEDKTCNKGLMCKYGKCIKDKCYDIECKNWESCNDRNGKCELKEGKCNQNEECKSGEVCDENTHECKKFDPCESNPCLFKEEANYCETDPDNPSKYRCILSPCSSRPCENDNLRICRPFKEDGKWHYECICKENYKENEEGNCIPDCRENCKEKNMTCEDYNDNPTCTSYDTYENCSDVSETIEFPGVWIGTTEGKDDDYSAETCSMDIHTPGYDTVYMIDTDKFNEDIKIILNTFDEAAYDANISLYTLDESCSLCQDISTDEDKFKKTLTLPQYSGIHYIVVDSQTDIPFDYTLKIEEVTQ